MIDVETNARFLAEKTGIHHAPQGDRRSVLGIADLLVEDFHYGQLYVDPYHVHQLQRTHRVMEPQLHTAVDFFYGRTLPLILIQELLC